ncbi:NINE protein [Ketobacter alkanivorans]|uniref:Pilin n=1 Tax=Ketobacter alkanivorans TaxID=1917421 RepID=A0A2K9LK89_9GAMM|nr:NINE protein [Ketobacter alkanivorans]AUM12758.1 hypothetical protein Kalk_10155 [Ketobacter alkanivorans]
MTEPRYNIVLTGHIQPGQDATAVAAKLAALMKLPPEKAQALLQGNASKVKTELDEATARRYLAALENTGAQVRMDELVAAVQPLTLEPAAPTPPPAHQPTAAEEPSTPTPYATPADDHLHPDEMRFCSHCGGEAPRLARSCPHCKRKLPTLGRSREVAALLAFLPTGAWGVHRFYLGQWWGIFYLLLCWTGIPSVISLVEFVVFLCTGRESWDAKHGHKNAVSGWIWVIPSLFILIMILGVVAAVAIPAYQDYLTRSQVNQTLYEVETLEQEITDFIERTNFVPNSGIDMGKSDVGELTYATWSISENAVITLTFDSSTDIIAGESITLIPYLEEDAFIWDCTGGTLDPKYRPIGCQPE